MTPEQYYETRRQILAMHYLASFTAIVCIMNDNEIDTLLKTVREQYTKPIGTAAERLVDEIQLDANDEIT